VRAVLEKEGINPDDVIMSPAAAKARGGWSPQSHFRAGILRRKDRSSRARQLILRWWVPTGCFA